MFIWTTSEPNRDGALSNDVIIHEMMHGVTNRMVGGGRATCLQSNLAGGLGEGWGDAMAKFVKTVKYLIINLHHAAGCNRSLRRLPIL